MIRKAMFLCTTLMGCLLYFGCGGGNDDSSGNGENGGSSDADSDSDSDGDSDVDGDGDADFAVCEVLNTDLEAVPSRVMILEDKSGSMDDDNKWNLAMGAIETIVNEFDSEISFGLDVFNVNTGGGGGGGWNNRDDPMCDVGDSVVRDVALNAGDDILRTLRNYSPGNATPLLLAMMNFTESGYAPIFQDRRGKSYLVIISDGMDTCGRDGRFDRNGGASAQELAAVARDLGDNYSINTIVIGFGQGADPDQLNAIAEAGGTRFDEYLSAADGGELTSSLNTIAKTVVVSCVFEIGTFDEDEVNLDLVNITFDGEPVPRDDDCEKGVGWTWANSERTAIQFCKEACELIESESVDEMRVEIACTEGDVIMV